MPDIVPDSMKVRWDLAGIPGGIPAPGTIHATIDATGDTTNRLSAITTALNAAPPGTRVLLGPGLFYVGAGFRKKSGVELCGSGMSATRLIFTGTHGFGVDLGNGDQDWPYNTTGDAITSDVPKGSTVLPMAGGTANWVAGDIAVLTQLGPDYTADPTLIECSSTSSNKDRLRRQYVEIASKTADSLTLVVPTYWDLALSRSPVAHRMARGFHVGGGLRDLTLDFSEGHVTRGVDVLGAVRCYMQRVRVLEPDNYGIYLMSSFQCEVKECYIDLNYGTGGNNGAGILMERLGACRVWDNIMYRCVPHTEMNFGCAGCVVAYNFANDSTAGTSPGFAQAGSLNVNHGPHCAFNLLEGNHAPSVWSDGWFGSASELLVARNRLHGTNEDGPGVGKTETSRCVDLGRFTRKCPIVGNSLGMPQSWWSSRYGLTMIKEPETSNYPSNRPVIYKLGYPNLGNQGFTGTASLIDGDPWADWPTGAGAGGYQERDLDVAATTLLKHNWNGYDNAIHASEALAEGETIADSYFLSEKPDWFGTLAWPPYDPNSPVIDPVESAKRIPAGYRYYMGGDPPMTNIPTHNRVRLARAPRFFAAVPIQ